MTHINNLNVKLNVQCRSHVYCRIFTLQRRIGMRFVWRTCTPSFKL